MAGEITNPENPARNIIMADPSGYTAAQIAARQAHAGKIELPRTSYRSYALEGCSQITQVVANSLTTIPEWFLANCTKLEQVIAQKATNVGQMGFAGCSKLQLVDMMGGKTGMASLSHSGCRNLSTMIIRWTEGIWFPNTNSFQGVAGPIQVYVPSAVKANYEDSATNGNWNAYLTRGTVVFHELEGSAYENLNWWRD